ncbi:hypothetical protein T01_1583 [Trichinella spiralis]|uniref:Uncharacterized protein n=1 Tax=Trichinella spiralis TaxID=6334 RepID=A0A0V1B5C9_TRISP|nr:hypothetical protein T01_1583 [Trichinella spiralis]
MIGSQRVTLSWIRKTDILKTVVSFFKKATSTFDNVFRFKSLSECNPSRTAQACALVQQLSNKINSIKFRKRYNILRKVYDAALIKQSLVNAVIAVDINKMN